MYIHRAIEAFLAKALKQFPACLITGPRQAGKSTLLRKFLKSHRYVSLDDPFIANLAKKDPKLFLSSYPALVIIDEIQYAPELLRYIKILIDEDRQNYGQFVLTGSQVFSLMKGVSESLAGRIAIFHLYPLSWQELQPAISDSQYNARFLPKQIIQGFYPEFITNPEMDKRLWFSSYISTYVERDIRNIKSITDIGRFQTFIGLLATRAGQLLNMSEIAKECGISQPTAKDWVFILESTYLIYLLKPFYNNLSKRLVKSPKLYFVDTGILCYLMGISNEDQFMRSPQAGSIFENMVIMEMRKRYALEKQHAQFFFYRTGSGIEVDLIIQEGARLNAFEIKFAQTLSKDMTKALSLFQEEHPCKSAQVLSLQKEKTPLKPGISSIHWSDVD